jgi:L-ascorbate metabolism protein UlaG (beta-lactamase superfamily)
MEEQGKRLVIDPGKFSTSLPELSDVVGVVITHIHSDHFDETRVQNILKQNPEAQIFTVEQVATELAGSPIKTVKAEQVETTGPFSLKFFGGNHELYEGFQNIGVLVNDKLFHPGDSYAKPTMQIPLEVLAAPASAPWLRVSEATQFIKDCSAKKVFPIHNALLSEIGESIHYRILSEAAQEAGSQWLVLKPGESLQI